MSWPRPAWSKSGGDQLASWPADAIVCRREKPHPGAQLSLFEEIDGWRYQLVATNTPGPTAQFLEARHRPHARVEDCIRCGKQTGLGHLPSTSIDINRAWRVAAAIATDLLCWLRLLCLEGTLAKAEPKTLRYRILQTPYPDHPRRAQTQNPHPRHLALGNPTRRLLPRGVRPTPTDRMLISDTPAPDPRNNPRARGTPALTRRDSRTSSLNRTLTTRSTSTPKINVREPRAAPVTPTNDQG